MNTLLHLKGRFEQAPAAQGFGAPNLPSGKLVSVSKLEKLQSNLKDLQQHWEKDKILPGALVSVYYNKVAAKSNRVNGLLSQGMVTAHSSIVGARFTKGDSPKHIITHYVPLSILQESINRLDKAINILNEQFSGTITHDIIKKINGRKIKLISTQIPKTNFLKVIVDAYYVERLGILVDDVNLIENSIITIYKTEVETISLMDSIGINLQFNRVMDGTTILLRPDELALLKQRAPYLISMAITDVSQLTKDNFDFCNESTITIPSPKDEPVIGVIDTMFDQKVYFSEWVDFKNMLSEDIPLTSNDYEHGTAVSSIIVDGSSVNPHIDDGCGRFRVKHFGVASENQFSSFSVLRNINEIVLSNKNIKVWNLSLGSKLEIDPNFISPEAAILDKIQYENDVIFVIAGTNKTSTQTFIGSPADSINSLVVNSVDIDNQPALYSRRGPVLSFFTKPDISYYGGDSEQPMRVCTPTGEALVQGTSYAAPWIARKMAYLINILGLSREVAKALIVNSATGWEKQTLEPSLIGHGIVPIKIDSIIQCPDDEIQFILSGISEKYNTYNFNIPVPVANSKHPFISKATLCYFPCCSRDQGVDYTNTELDIQFGRLKDNGIKPINNNYQSDLSEHYTWEKDARKNFRKWDNVKHIREVSKAGNRAKKSYNQGIWGISLKTKERLEKKYGEDMKFGIIISLKAIDGVNRINDFIKNCLLRGWLVNKIDVQNRIDIYNIAEEEIDFSDF